MLNSLRSFSLATVLLLLPATRVVAQNEVAVLPGEPVRVQIVGPAGAAVGARCTGRVTSAAQDTLLVMAGGSCARGNYLASFQVIRGDRGSRLDHIGYGVVAGGVIGALIGKATSKTTYNSNGQINRGQMWAGAAVGGLLGGAAGYFYPSGPAWVRAGTPRPLRIIGMNVRPGVEVAVGGAR